MNCAQCGESNPADIVACKRCGEPLLDGLSATGATAPLEADPMAVTGAIELEDRSSTRPAAPPEPTAVVAPTGFGADETHFEPTAPGAAATAPAARRVRVLSAGTVFAGRYEVLALIGEGGMGEVYKVRDRELDRVIALKTVRSDSDEGEMAVQRFKQELLLARRITHKNVIRIHDLGEADGIKFFTMEFVEGESLKALIRRKTRLSAPEAIALSRPILSALQEAHAQGVIHRDLSRRT
jgi:predicted Ser/Thr protein kinase